MTDARPEDGPHGPAQHESPDISAQDDPITTLADVASSLAKQQSPEAMMQQVVTEAVAAIPGCDEVGITIVRADGRLETPAATGEIAAKCDQIQYNHREGPCLDAFRSNRIVRVDDLASDTRWPQFALAAADLGICGLLALPLNAPRNLMGALNLYALQPNAFDDPEVERIAAAFVTHAAIAIMHAELEANLRIGMESREEIGRAVGILMERHRITASVAFERLVSASQRTHRKLREVAHWVNDTGEDPEQLSR
jgi:GAF domain-containing protein